MKRFMITVHPGGLHVQALSAAALENCPGVQYSDRNWKPVADLKSASEVIPLLYEAQQDVAAAHALNGIVPLERPEPPRAA